MNPFAASFQAVLEQIDQTVCSAGRPAGSVRLLAVSKTQPAERIRLLAGLGQRDFAENYVQEALPKMKMLRDLNLTWHYVGHVQSNKTAEIAQAFDWVHTVDRDKIARRLHDQRPPGGGALNVCVQVNVSGEISKSGVAPDTVEPLLETTAQLSNLRLRGLMALPALEIDLERQRLACRALAHIYTRFQARYGLDTLSMGTTADMKAAILEGTTCVRIGTALFGPRQ
jgi:pyridoxal phosphate enzyme (YggS family)